MKMTRKSKRAKNMEAAVKEDPTNLEKMLKSTSDTASFSTDSPNTR
jgi:hypothetical protein